jgi:hypothetical protein
MQNWNDKIINKKNNIQKFRKKLNQFIIYQKSIDIKYLWINNIKKQPEKLK